LEGKLIETMERWIEEKIGLKNEIRVLSHRVEQLELAEKQRKIVQGPSQVIYEGAQENEAIVNIQQKQALNNKRKPKADRIADLKAKYGSV